MHQFYDRRAAGQLLTSRLTAYRQTEAIVVAIPRGGIPIADEVAKNLGLAMDVFLVKKIGHPSNPEDGLGAGSLPGQTTFPHEEVNRHYSTGEVKRTHQDLEEMRRICAGEERPLKWKGRTVILIDDGIDTAETLLFTIRVLKGEHPAKIVVAVPVSSARAFHKIRQEADEVVSLLVPRAFAGVASYYANFGQIDDAEVEDCLRKRKTTS